MIYPKISDPVSVPNGTPDKTLFVSVDKTFGVGLKDPKTKQTVSLEDCARGYWKEQNLAAARGYDCDWLMARLHGRIVGVWKIDRTKGWMMPSVTPKSTWPSDKPVPPPSRRGCELIHVDDATQKKFLNKEVHLGRCQNSLRGYFLLGRKDFDNKVY